MRFSEIAYSPEQKALLEVLSGTALYVCVLNHSKGSNLEAIAKGAAIAGMHIFEKRDLKRYLAANPGQKLSRLADFEFIPGEEPTGTYISFLRFMGDGYDPVSGGVSFYQPKKDVLPLFDPQKDQGKGLAHALFNPPYGFRPPGIPPENSFGTKDLHGFQMAQKQFLNEFFLHFGIVPRTDTARQHIFSWSDNWCEFFEIGKEWWGTFYWTIHHPDRREIIVIGASKTD